MSSTMIAAIVGCGVLALIMIAFISQKVEAGRVERERSIADLSDRIKRCAQLSEALPGQFMTVELKQLLNRIEAALIDRLSRLKPLSSAMEARKTELTRAMDEGEALKPTNAPRALNTEARVKELRALLEALHGTLVHASQLGIVDAHQANGWVADIRYMLTMSYVEFFRHQGERQLRSEHYIQARQSFERAVQQIRKQPQSERYTALLAQLDMQIEQAKALQSQANQLNVDDTNELSERVDILNEDSWRKKKDYE